LLYLKDLGFDYSNFSLAFSTDHNRNNKLAPTKMKHFVAFGGGE